MYKRIFLLFSLIVVSAAFSVVSAQTPEIGITDSKAGGEVVSVTDTSITVKTKDGVIDAIVSNATVFKKVSPLNVRDITPAVFADISAGDKVLVSGTVSADKKTVPARTVYLLTKAAITQRNTSVVEQWRTRGIAGRVVSVNSQAKQITIAVSRMTGLVNVVVTAKDNAKFERFPQGSYNYKDAKKSSISEINARDEFRAYGDRSEDGTTFTAEGVLTGAPAQVTVGAVKSIDTAKNEVVIIDGQTKKDLTVVVGPSIMFLKKYPEELAKMLAGAQNGGGAAPGGQVMVRPAGAANPQGGAPAQGGPAGAGMGGRGGINEMVERFPNITLADLKAGDLIAVVSASKAPEADRIDAIKLISGVEPFMKMAQMAAASGGPRPGQGGVSGSFTIPGLDGIGGP
jgi:hypothetical protein